jgi:hypothetical protein
LQSSRAGTAKGERDDLTGVGGGVCNEETPRDTFQRLSDRQEGERVGLVVGQLSSDEGLVLSAGYSRRKK